MGGVQMAMQSFISKFTLISYCLGYTLLSEGPNGWAFNSGKRGHEYQTFMLQLLILLIAEGFNTVFIEIWFCKRLGCAGALRRLFLLLRGKIFFLYFCFNVADTGLAAWPAFFHSQTLCY